jgi:glycosyltransferase involved in cell wall biosynthesis
VTTLSRPLISIGMPVYNCEAYLRQALNSLLKQTYQDLELIISDNASTDGTANICAEYASRDKRIRYIRQPHNIGAPRNWNAVVYEARGEFFKWASGNDYCAPDTLALCLAAMQREPDIVLAYGRTELVDNDGVSLGIYEGDLNINEARPSDRFEQVLKRLALNNAQQGLIRTDPLRRTKLDRFYPGGDIPLMAELALYGRFILLPHMMLYRRFAPGTVMTKSSPLEVARIYNPGAKNPPRFLCAQQRLDNLFSVLRSAIPQSEKIRACAIVLKYVAWDRKELWAEVRSLWSTLPTTKTSVK